MSSSILVINCGSSSLKFALIDTTTQHASLTGLAEKLGLDDAQITFKHQGEKTVQTLAEGNHAAAMRAILAQLQGRGLFDSVQAIGHRVVHGGERFKASTLIDDEVIAAIEDCARLAPLHNPAHVLGIRTAIACFPGLPQVAVFDTAFHQSMPQRAYLYPVPMALYREHGVRRYGFHGTSYRFVSAEAARMLGKPLEETALVCAHLGNGASAAAILGGKSVDTTMGLTPLEGLVMGTRSGDVDPGLFGYLASELKLDVNAITELLNKQSGLLGLSELSSDCRELEDAALAGDGAAQLALEVFSYRLAKQIAALTVALGRLDAVLFTGGIGENSSYLRERVVKLLGFLGLRLDTDANDRCVRGQAGCITAPGSVPALVINTNEELMIALDTAALATPAALTR
ncbi:acetate/propionate family kinase [Pseudogulbenkiania ferrooxidans]|uniref:Acetate kinase n=1 Tax=Pseudogulbenkiania ferrooxidans 2002 TaxID=279714 RepID=B9Z2B2_9NEIS|nr:acetate kinase [Pseudogulbenkiania ferrooxidans]EEG09088.1 acetate kinase [Pseudogulbenkiania ferrooxidans 2002]